MPEANATESGGRTVRIVKGAFAPVSGVSSAPVKVAVSARLKMVQARFFHNPLPRVY